jgi:hypothetical protein
VFFLDTARRPELTCEQDVIGYVAQAFARLGFNPDKIIVSACEAPGWCTRRSDRFGKPADSLVSTW